MLIFILAWMPCVLYAQIVPSSCTTDDSVVALFRADAHTMALEVLEQRHSKYLDSIEIPSTLVDSILAAVSAVNKAKILPQRDSVFELYKIHNYNNFHLNHFVLFGDSSAEWMKRLEDGQWPSGNSALDDAHDAYGFELLSLRNHHGTFLNEAHFESEHFSNIAPLTKRFTEVDTMSEATKEIMVGGGNSIKCRMDETGIYLDFNHAWGDCPAGCTWEYTWSFIVYPSCSVEFLGNQGTKPYPLGMEDLLARGLKIFPNPAFDYIQISGLEDDLPYKVICTDGRVCIKGLTGEGDIDVRKLESGTYILLLQKGNETTPFTFVKH